MFVGHSDAVTCSHLVVIIAYSLWICVAFHVSVSVCACTSRIVLRPRVAVLLAWHASKRACFFRLTSIPFTFLHSHRS
jgi:hypothetical protein